MVKLNKNEEKLKEYILKTGIWIGPVRSQQYTLGRGCWGYQANCHHINDGKLERLVQTTRPEVFMEVPEERERVCIRDKHLDVLFSWLNQ